jgi:hypothetical protein
VIVAPDANIFISQIELGMGCTDQRYFGDIGLRGKIPWFFKDYCRQSRSQVITLPTIEITILSRLHLAHERVFTGKHRCRQIENMKYLISFLENDPRELNIEELLVKTAILHYLEYHKENLAQEDVDRQKFLEILFETSEKAKKMLYNENIFPLNIEFVRQEKIVAYDTPDIQEFSEFILRKCEIPYEKNKNGVEIEDRDSLIEAFKISSMRNQVVCFLTEDGGILSDEHKTVIEKKSGNNLVISNSSSFYDEYSR